MCDKAGVRRFGFHALRSFVASTLSGKYKFSTGTIQQILGHEKVTPTEIYIQNFRNDVQQGMDGWLKARLDYCSRRKKSGIPRKYPASF
ncbi:MAG: hypothetical protein ACLQBD_15890 [Syntrophobacteraceae bacterium]